MITIAETMKITGATLLQGDAKGEIKGISTDSCTLKSGELFIALRGDKFDGHDFILQAFARGAAAALISRAPREKIKGTLLQVADTLQALGALAADWRRRFQLPVIAITGSVGKTTTKEMLASILAQIGEVLKTQENFNNEIGVPLTMFQLSPRHKAAVFELAMRGPGQIRYLAEIVLPKIGVITNIGSSHLESFDSPKAIAESKAELLEAQGEDGFAVLDCENEYFSVLQKKAKKLVTFGFYEGDVHAEEVVTAGEKVNFRLWLPKAVLADPSDGEAFPVSLPLPGRHNVANALAAAAAAKCLGISAEQIVRGLESFQSLPGRLNIIKAPRGFTIIDDTYNASPDSMRAALGVLADMQGKRKIAILGEMRELGADSALFHRTLGRQTAAMPLALLITVGELGKETASAAADALASFAIEPVADAQAALKVVKGLLQGGDLILVKASRALGLEAVVNGLMTD